MHAKERATIISLAAIMAFRMLGLFMLLPVFALYTSKIALATPALMGFALGIYGVFQACFQIPFGILSDHLGRKPVLVVGLILLGLGSIVAAVAHSIYWIIIGRALQGAGAIGSTILAAIADLTGEEDRSKAMALVGMTIGFSFAVAIILGPAISARFQLSGIFWVTALFSGFGIVLVYTAMPTLPKVFLRPNEVKTEKGYFKKVILDKQLLRLDLGIFSLHCILTAFFIGIPIVLSQVIRLTEYQQVPFYLSTMLLSFIVVIPLIVVAERKQKLKSFFLGSIIFLVICPILLFLLPRSISVIGTILFLFLTAFTLLEAILPSLMSKVAPIRYKGTAMGIYSSAQFLGIFVGGSIGGWIFGHFNVTGLSIFCAVVGLVWLVFVISMKPLYTSTIIVKLNKSLITDLADLNQRLCLIEGVLEVSMSDHKNLIYLKIDKKIISEDKLRKQIRQGNLDTD